MREKGKENPEAEENLTKCICSLHSFIHLFNTHGLSVNCVHTVIKVPVLMKVVVLRTLLQSSKLGCLYSFGFLILTTKLKIIWLFSRFSYMTSTILDAEERSEFTIYIEYLGH